jgi:hypothetical protein
MLRSIREILWKINLKEKEFFTHMRINVSSKVYLRTIIKLKVSRFSLMVIPTKEVINIILAKVVYLKEKALYTTIV